MISFKILSRVGNMTSKILSSGSLMKAKGMTSIIVIINTIINDFIFGGGAIKEPT